MLTFSKHQHIIYQIALIAIILTNLYLFHLSWLGIILTILYIWFNSKKLSDILFHKLHKGLKNISGFLTILSYIAINYTVFYHLYIIDQIVFLWVLISIPLFIELLSLKSNKTHYFLNGSELNFKFKNIKRIILPISVLALDILLFILLFKKASVGIVRSPWELLHFKFWFLFTLSNILLIFSIINKKTIKSLALISFHFLLLSSIAIILYPLGYGYDSFIHEATLNIIKETGTIQPKLLMYLGQYGLSFFFHTISQVSLDTVNKILLPILFSLIWPTSIYYGLRHGFNWTKKASYLSTFWSLFIGFSFAIMTTPQSLSYLIFAFFIFILPEINKKKIHLHFIYLLTLFTLAIHPLSGVTLFLFSIILTIFRIKKRKFIRSILFSITLFFSIIALPLLFAFYQFKQGIEMVKIFSFNTWPLISLPNIHWNQTYSFPLDIIHNISSNIIWIYVLCVLISILFILRENKYLFYKRYFLFSGILIANYIITKIFISFNLQISYDKTDYLNRIVYLITLTTLPFFLRFIYIIFKTTIIKNNDKLKNIFLLITTIFIIIIGTYFSYPVYDKHKNSKSFNVTSTDIKTVQAIEEDSNNTPYIVLANQMVGAASINQYNFKHYYNNNFYYSMPLGIDNIYTHYLNMIEINANKEEALKAMDKAQVNKLYFVVNNYWHSAKQSIKQAKNSSDSYFLIDNGVNHVFVYNK